MQERSFEHVNKGFVKSTVKLCYAGKTMKKGWKYNEDRQVGGASLHDWSATEKLLMLRKKLCRRDTEKQEGIKKEEREFLQGDEIQGRSKIKRDRDKEGFKMKW